MYAWGSGKYGQTGLGSKADQTRPAEIPNEDGTWPAFTSIAVAPKFNIGLTAEGELYSWGTGVMGELGLAYITNQPTPAKITKLPTGLRFKQVAIGYEHTLAISEQGDIYVWGANDLGQLGTGDLKPVDRPRKLKLPSKFVQLAAGTKHSMALNEHGFLYAWGGGWAGQLGDNEAKSYLTPKLLSEDLTFKYISAGDYCSVAINSTLSIRIVEKFLPGEVEAMAVWGMLPAAVKFSGPVVSSESSQPNGIVSNGNANDVHGNHSDAKNPNGEHSDANGSATKENGADDDVSTSSSFGQQTSTRSRSLPKEEIDLNPYGPFVDIALGRNFSVAINQKGECFTWGNSRNGVLGDGEESGITRFASKIPTQVKLTKVFASRDHIIAFGSGKGAPITQEKKEEVVDTSPAVEEAKAL